MSGGSFSYLCSKAEEPERLVSAASPTEGFSGEMVSECQLQPMADLIRERHGAHPNAERTAKRTEEVKALVDQAVALLAKIRETAAPLAEVWKAAEWHADSDWGPEAVAEALDALK